MTVETIEMRLAAVEERIQRACERSGRSREEVHLVAVTKKHGPEIVREAASCGITTFGESRVQEALAKIPACPGHLLWHLVGHLQTNKVRRAVPHFEAIHSVDSSRLLDAVNRGCDQGARAMRVFIQVNVSGEASKYGLPPEDLQAVLEESMQCARLEVVGLMTIPPFYEDAEKTRPHFVQLRELRDRAREEMGFPMDELSMGMSHDFEIAVEEGATWIRLGTVLFGERY